MEWVIEVLDGDPSVGEREGEEEIDGDDYE